MSNFWLNVVTTLKIVWVWLKQHWSLLVFGVVAVASGLLLKNRTDMLTALLKQQEETSKQHRQEVAELQRIRDEEIRKREQIESQYRETIARINRDHQAAVDQLTRDKQTELRRIIGETVNNPDAMASRINDLFGIPIYHP